MKNYNFKRLSKEDKDALLFIAKIHEELPSAWIDGYKVYDESINKTFEELILKHKNKRVYCSVIEYNGRVISYIWAEVNVTDNEQVDIMSLWTDKEYRGNGIATKLKIELEKWAKNEINAKKIHTTVSSKNENMIKLNEKLGYSTRYYRMIKDL